MYPNGSTEWEISICFVYIYLIKSFLTAGVIDETKSFLSRWNKSWGRNRRFLPAVGNTRPTTVKETVDNFFEEPLSPRSLYEKSTLNEANFALLRNRVSHLVTTDNFKVLIWVYRLIGNIILPSDKLPFSHANATPFFHLFLPTLPYCQEDQIVRSISNLPIPYRWLFSQRYKKQMTLLTINFINCHTSCIFYEIKNIIIERLYL